jgi:hypothetical protein
MDLELIRSCDANIEICGLYPSRSDGNERRDSCDDNLLPTIVDFPKKIVCFIIWI